MRLSNLFRRREFKIFLTIWLVYVFFISEYGGNWMADHMLSESLAIINDHSFVVDNYIPEGCKVSGCDLSFSNGHFYSGFAPGASIVPIPILLLFKPLFLLLPEVFMGYSKVKLSVILANILATIFVSSLLSALLSVLLYRFSKYFTLDRKIRLLMTFTFAFGTLFFSYSTGYASRIIGTLFSFSAFYLLFKSKHEGVRSSHIFFAGLLGGAAVFTEYTQAIVVVFLFIYLLTFLRDKKLFYFILGGVLMAVPLMAYHYSVFDNPFSTAYAHRAGPDKDIMAPGFYGSIFPPDSYVLWALSFGFEKGIIWFVPITILSFFGLFLVLRNRNHKYFTEMLIISLLFLAFFVYNSSIVFGWQANCAFGPRHFTSSMPFLMLPLIFAYERIKFKLGVIFSSYSIFINLLPVFYGQTVLWRSFEGVGCNSTNAIFKEYMPLIFERGITNYTLNLIKYKIYDLPIYLINILALSGILLLAFIIWLLWRKQDKGPA